MIFLVDWSDLHSGRCGDWWGRLPFTDLHGRGTGRYGCTGWMLIIKWNSSPLISTDPCFGSSINRYTYTAYRIRSMFNATTLQRRGESKWRYAVYSLCEISGTRKKYKTKANSICWAVYILDWLHVWAPTRRSPSVVPGTAHLRWRELMPRSMEIHNPVLTLEIHRRCDCC